MVTYRCPYCHTNRANEDKYHAGRCENCGGALEAIGGDFVVPPGYPLCGIESTTGTLNTTMDTVNIEINYANFDREILERELNAILAHYH